MAIRTIDDEPHLSKVIVPAKTHVNAEHLFRDNDLNCLRFDECDPADHFDEYQRHIYSEISSTEHQRGYKEYVNNDTLIRLFLYYLSRVRIHMFNLYQNQFITKEIIETKQLNACRLVFWLCVYRNEEYLAVSQPSFSSIIEESKFYYSFFSLFTLVFLFFRKNDCSVSHVYSNEPNDIDE